MAVIAVQQADQGLASVTFAAANGGGDTVIGGSRGGGWDLATILIIRNTDAATKTVTVAGHPAVIVPATTGVAVVPVYGQPHGAVKAVTYSAVTGVTVAAVRVAPVPSG